MKFISSSIVWSRGMDAVQNATGSSLSNPIVENILVTCSEDKVSFTATDLQLTIRCEGEAKVEEAGTIVVPKKMIKKIVRIVRGFPSEEVSFTENNQMISIQCGTFRGKIKGQSGDLFPPFMKVDKGEEISMNVEILKEIIKKTIYVTSQEKSRYELNGVKFDKLENELKCISTDGRRLSVYTYKDESMTNNVTSALIPVGTLKEIVHSLPDEGIVKLISQERKIQISCGDTTLVSNLMVGKFPQYDRLIPTVENIKIKMNRDKFISSVRRAGKNRSTETQVIVMNITHGKMEIFCEQTETGGEGRDTIDVDYEGEQLEIRYNYRFLMEFLKVMNEEEVELTLWNPEKPGIFRGVGNEKYIYVLMPM